MYDIIQAYVRKKDTMRVRTRDTGDMKEGAPLTMMSERMNARMHVNTDTDKETEQIEYNEEGMTHERMPATSCTLRCKQGQRLGNVATSYTPLTQRFFGV